MFVGEYAAKFHELMKYWPYFQHEDGDEDLCTQFENGLRPEIWGAISVFQLTDLPTLDSKCRIFEANSKGGSSSGSTLSRGPVRCFRCGGPHIVRNFPQPPSTCGICKKMSHSANTCWYAPQKSGSISRSNRPASRGSIGAKLNVQGKVFAMNGSETSKSDDLIRGKCIINDRLCDVLFDSSVTHSFVSMDCVNGIGLPISSVPYNVVVSTLTAKLVVTSSVCLGCFVMIHGRNFCVDLIYLPLSQLDVVLGMDWLSSNRVLLDCKEKVLIFDDDTLRKSRLQNVGEAKTFMVLFFAEVDKTVKAEHIPVVQDFLEVFPEDVTELPPEKEIEFTIDLISRAILVSIAPYQISPVKLAEVKKQVEDLLKRQFVRPSVSPWGTLVLLVKKKDMCGLSSS
ncbi:uncharacterized protein LOC113874295 [Abrus precatorius]|uniref:Uncharacterized protein LOC113874295 n=1 Tax=Abrus precatorius TaxID=3816 RepID=A0A8B8MIC7_ABRPR|nr:uncharacterized protein LOC113874295 [Abrus precatorius]